jgi:hypothetical protein
VRAAWYADRILNGTKPQDLPVEAPIYFELAINLRTAKQINWSNDSAQRASEGGQSHQVRSTMAEPDKRPVSMEELLVSSLAQPDALAKLLIEKGLITREEFMQKISEERAK